MTTPAFPSTNALATASGVMTQGHPGMDLRDYFAAKAMPSVLAPNPVTGQFALVGDFPACAFVAYAMADAMLAAREGGAA
jgi:hypothetical protein